MLRSVKDIVDAVDAGRIHTQRFTKNTSATSGDNKWIDWSFASGQPAYDARIGGVGTFTPAVATKNDAVFFPSMSAGQERRLLEFNVFTNPNGASQTRVQIQIADLLGFYPLIDGDSTDVQSLDNTATLPRYATGAGVFPLLVNHVAPAISTADLLVTYTNSDGVSGRTVTWTANLNGTGCIAYQLSSAGGNGAFVCTLAAGDKGIRSIDDVQFITPPGGLWAIYLVKPLVSHLNANGEALGSFGISETQLATQNGFNLPLIPDGAWLSLFYMTTGGARADAFFGNFTFVWG